MAAAALAAMMVLAASACSPKPQAETLAVSLRVSASKLEIVNEGSGAWKTAVIYLNGFPPHAYKHTVPAPAVGQTVAVDLTQFVNRDGKRFQPHASAVTKVWIGGDAYAYTQHEVTR